MMTDAYDVVWFMYYGSEDIWRCGSSVWKKTELMMRQLNTVEW